MNRTLIDADYAKYMLLVVSSTCFCPTGVIPLFASLGSRKGIFPLNVFPTYISAQTQQVTVAVSQSTHQTSWLWTPNSINHMERLFTMKVTIDGLIAMMKQKLPRYFYLQWLSKLSTTARLFDIFDACSNALPKQLSTAKYNNTVKSA